MRRVVFLRTAGLLQPLPLCFLSSLSSMLNYVLAIKKINLVLLFDDISYLTLNVFFYKFDC
jgi:hypothetical protein